MLLCVTWRAPRYLFFLILSYLILSYLILSYLILSIQQLFYTSVETSRSIYQLFCYCSRYNVILEGFDGFLCFLFHKGHSYRFCFLQPFKLIYCPAFYTYVDRCSIVFRHFISYGNLSTAHLKTHLI